MDDNMTHLPPETGQDHSKRDAETQIVLGIFIITIAIPVLVGTFFAVRPHAMVVNVIAGLVLLTVGVILLVLGKKAKKRSSS